MEATLKETEKKALVASQCAAMGAMEATTIRAVVAIAAKHLDRHGP